MPFDSTPIVKESVNVTILRQIREQIAAGRWIKGNMSDFKGNHCIAGWWHHFDKRDNPANQFHPLVECLGGFIVNINDATSTTKEQMVHIIDVAIERLQSA